MLEIGQKIKMLRELKNPTQLHVAKQLNMTQPAYSKIETGETELKVSHINDLAKVFDMEAEALFAYLNAKNKQIFIGKVSENQQGGVSNGVVYSFEQNTPEILTLLKKIAEKLG
jgi:transcriptional regulator with XRE-family HTH domain